MKIFVTSDIHGDFNILAKIITFLKGREDIEALILCGDISADHSSPSFEDLEAYQYEDYIEIMELLKQTGKKVKFILGNHDVFNIDRRDTSYLPNCSKEDSDNFIPIEYINFFMYGTKREGNEEEMKTRVARLEIDNKSIVISHIPPYKCLDKAKNGVYHGSEAIRNMIKEKQPTYFFCGHVHEAFGFKKLYNTFVFNVACEKDLARGWVVDLESGEKEKVMLNGQETRHGQKCRFSK